jgi:NAD(P)H-dependent flavin oxidoreductase YrpB (nitropropane dioxygenase family)
VKIGNLEAQSAIIGGGMGVALTLSEIATEIINSGGIGTLTSLTHKVRDGDEANHLSLAREIQQVISNCGKNPPLLVNIMYALNDFEMLVKTAVDNNAGGLVVGAGLPNKLPRIVDEFEKDKKESEKLALLPIVSSARALRIILKKWQKSGRKPDGIVFENPLLAGGHEGGSKEEILANDKKYFYRYALAEIFDVLAEFGDEYMHIPLIAAGGIQPEDSLYLFNLTNSRGQRIAGIQIATPFLTTKEVGISSEATQAELDANQQITTSHKKNQRKVIIESTASKMAARANFDDFTQRVIAELRNDIQNPVRKRVSGCVNCLGSKCAYPYTQWCIMKALLDFQRGLHFSGRRPLPNREFLDSVAKVMELYNFQNSIPPHIAPLHLQNTIRKNLQNETATNSYGLAA